MRSSVLLCLTLCGLFQVSVSQPGMHRLQLCESSEPHLIVCPKGSTINVISGFYGRADATACGGGSSSTCVQANATEIIEKYCLNRESCVITPSTDVFGDPCVGTSKYMILVYICQARKVVIACENANAAVLSCPVGQGINLISANFGRSDKRTCVQYGMNWDTKCSAVTSMETVIAQCSGRNSCTVSPTITTFDGVDPCPGTSKYLEIAYKCIGWPSVQACQGDSVYMSCSDGQVINAISSLYGRVDTITCTGDGGQLGDTSCAVAAATTIAADVCNGQTECSIPATNDVFGDPCPSTLKYLNISVSCAYVAKLPPVCESSKPLRISCDLGQVVYIVSALFGRSDLTTCPRTGSPTSSTNCTAEAATSQVKAICNGHTSCYIIPSTQTFGDPCPGTSKYLQISYFCAATVNAATAGAYPVNPLPQLLASATG